jgi:hypothetical protein
VRRFRPLYPNSRHQKIEMKQTIIAIGVFIASGQAFALSTLKTKKPHHCTRISESQNGWFEKAFNNAAHFAATTLVIASVLLQQPALAENELSAKYGGGLDTSLVDQTCLVNHCSLQAKACLADDPDCRKGLTCTAKCLGDNSCITGCMARYGNSHLDNLLKCTIEGKARFFV